MNQCQAEDIRDDTIDPALLKRSQSSARFRAPLAIIIEGAVLLDWALNSGTLKSIELMRSMAKQETAVLHKPPELTMLQAPLKGLICRNQLVCISTILPAPMASKNQWVPNMRLNELPMRCSRLLSATVLTLTAEAAMLLNISCRTSSGTLSTRCRLAASG
jgi:hypothetical protein